MIRTTDAAYVNSLVNHPSIRPHIGGDPEAELDLSSIVEDQQNYFLVSDHGGFAYTWSAPHCYEVHTFILPEGRGASAYSLARKSLKYMVEAGASYIWTRVHPDAANVRQFTLAAGFSSAGTHRLDLGLGPITYDLFDWRVPCL